MSFWIVFGFFTAGLNSSMMAFLFLSRGFRGGGIGRYASGIGVSRMLWTTAGACISAIRWVEDCLRGAGVGVAFVGLGWDTLDAKQLHLDRPCMSVQI